MWIALLAQLSLSTVLGAYTQCYVELLGLDRTWKITVTYENLEEDHLAGTFADPTYYNAWVSYDTTQIKIAMGDGSLSGVHLQDAIGQLVLHELWHIVLWEFAELAEEIHQEQGLQLEEQLITTIIRRPHWTSHCRLARKENP